MYFIPGLIPPVRRLTGHELDAQLERWHANSHGHHIPTSPLRLSTGFAMLSDGSDRPGRRAKRIRTIVKY